MTAQALTAGAPRLVKPYMAVELFFIILQKCVNVRAVQQRIQQLQPVTVTTCSWFYLVLSYVPYERVPVTTVYWEARGKNKDS